MKNVKISSFSSENIVFYVMLIHFEFFIFLKRDGSSAVGVGSADVRLGDGSLAVAGLDDT